MKYCIKLMNCYSIKEYNPDEYISTAGRASNIVGVSKTNQYFHPHSHRETALTSPVTLFKEEETYQALGQLATNFVTTLL